ncbi:hypothetical protein A4H97_24770 [Niastella yeongjuensis]|uniref:RNA polymerase sigma-70 factor n=1 Tax=Niastella yeongjuensis TaxID=354355 RepID=A0A1V9F2H2_9BACT|nr:RNA polymerase sigma-70 factor [Niastella yeongjuensis]OQP52544.1 hypothetical protein A4H97_24770 [Niastella yeongjuensis]SEP34593.1 RNA polymerase sigma-70 factor, ECF subfamily [Niastella yeongjuensis]
MRIPHPVSFAETYNRYYNPLVFFARKFLIDPLVAEDIVTELFLKYWQKQDQFNSPVAIRSFLYLSTRNACINQNRKYRTLARVKTDLRILTDEIEESVLHSITRSELLHAIYSGVESLPQQCRRIILLSYLGGFSNKQIARHLRLSEQTVKNQKVRGIQLVRGKVLE